MKIVPSPLDDNQRLNWLRLIRSDNIGSISFFSLLERFGSAEEVLRVLPEFYAKGGKKVNICTSEKAEKELNLINRFGAKLISFCDIDYPTFLSEIDDPPPLITVKGDFSVLNKKAVGVVGSRNASITGKKIAFEFGKELSANSVVVVSGLARGIDAAAHEGAVLEQGGTIAVLGTGINIPYPHENLSLYKKITENGVIISELPFGTEPKGSNFPRRNRIISGISLGVVVIEASIRSGSLITAKMALEQGREVFAVPGSPKDPRAGGPNSLLKDGASLAESAGDIIRVIGVGAKPLIKRELFPTNHDRVKENFKVEENKPKINISQDNNYSGLKERILSKLGTAPVCVDEIIRDCQTSAGEVSMIILELELEGKLERHANNRVSILK